MVCELGGHTIVEECLVYCSRLEPSGGTCNVLAARNRHGAKPLPVSVVTVGTRLRQRVLRRRGCVARNQLERFSEVLVGIV